METLSANQRPVCEVTDQSQIAAITIVMRHEASHSSQYDPCFASLGCVKTVRISWVKTSCVWAIPRSRHCEGGLGPGQCHNLVMTLLMANILNEIPANVLGILQASRFMILGILTGVWSQSRWWHSCELSSWWMLESVFINGSPPNVT